MPTRAARILTYEAGWAGCRPTAAVILPSLVSSPRLSVGFPRQCTSKARLGRQAGATEACSARFDQDQLTECSTGNLETARRVLSRPPCSMRH